MFLKLITLFLFASTMLNAETISGKIKAKNGSLENYTGYVVYIKKVPEKTATQTRNSKIFVMNQVDKEFSPAYLAIFKNDKVDFKNSDDVFHNVFSLDPDYKFDLGAFKKDQSFSDDLKTKTKKTDTTIEFKKAGVANIYCNMHHGMVAKILVFDHIFFANVNKDGSFEMTKPEIDKFDLVLVGPRIESDTEVITSLAKETKNIVISFNPIEDIEVDEHKNKHGLDYSSGSGDIDELDLY